MTPKIASDDGSIDGYFCRYGIDYSSDGQPVMVTLVDNNFISIIIDERPWQVAVLVIALAGGGVNGYFAM